MTDTPQIFLSRATLITLLILAVYGSVLTHGFVWDDHYVIADNGLLENMRNIPRLFLMEDRVESPTGYYRPLTYLSFALDRALWGVNPAGCGVTNLLLHILVTLLFYYTLLLLFKKETLALVAALLFALHPVAGETVNFHAGGRNTLLCACFSLVTVILHLRQKRLLSVLPFALAILSKEFALLVPPFLLLYDRFIVREKIRWALYLPFILTIAGYLVVRSTVVTLHGNLLASLDLAKAFRLMPKLLGRYLVNMLFPVRLKVIYDLSAATSWPMLFIYSLALPAMAAAAWLLRKQREIVTSLLLFALFFLPVAGFFPVGTYLMADRYAYFSLFGFSLGLAWCLSRAGTGRIIGITATMLCFFAVIDIQRNGTWRDDSALAAQMITDAPELAIGYQNLGYEYYKKQDYGNAEKYLTLAYDKKNISKKMLVGSAAMFWEMNKLDKALIVLDKKIAAEPRSLQAYIMASRIYEEMGNRGMAASYRDKAVALNPGIFEMMRKRAFTVCSQGEELVAGNQRERAEMLYREALAIDPGYVPALIDMGILFAEKGESVKALNYFSKAALLDRANPVPHHNLSMVYDSLGKKSEARAEMITFRELEAASRGR